MVEAKREQYPLARKWNSFIKEVEKTKEIWEDLQKEITVVGDREIEQRYPALAQKYLAKFRKVEFHWMISMFVEYYRGAGGLDEMYIILPPESGAKTKVEEEKKDAD